MTTVLEQASGGFCGGALVVRMCCADLLYTVAFDENYGVI